MKIIVGLGNPGKDYENTRHNVGFMAVDALQKNKLPNGLVAKKSDRFMNGSGEFVKETISKHKLKTSDLYVVHDDLDIRLGEYKIQFGRGPKDHNGLKSIDTELGTQEYWHVRIGVDNRPLDNRPMGEEYVLQNFSDGEKEILASVIKRAVHELITNAE